MVEEKRASNMSKKMNLNREDLYMLKFESVMMLLRAIWIALEQKDGINKPH